MYTAWTSHIQDKAEKERFQNSIIGAKIVLNRLKTLIEEDRSSLENKECSAKVYDMPNWDYRQAHANGYKAALNTYIKLIDLNQQKEIQNDREPIS